MNYNNPQIGRAARIVYALCGSLFCLFCFLFLWRVQGGVLGMAQHVLSGGKTVYNPVMGALIITFVLWLLQQLLNLLFRLKWEWYFLSFFPSLLTLAMLTDVDASVYAGQGMKGWLWGYPVTLLLYVAVVWVVKHFPTLVDCRAYGREVRLLLPNSVGLLFLFLMVCGLSNTEENLHHQMKIEQEMVQGNYDAALQVASRSASANREMTAMRSFALAQKGELAECLFTYPQPFGAEGLLLPRKDTVQLRFSPERIYHYLGAYPHEGQAATDFLRTLSHLPRQAKEGVGDYLLCALLLDRRLPEFVKEFGRYYALSDSISLPRHYEEALVLYRHRYDVNLKYDNKVQEVNYADYRSCESEGGNPEELASRMRKEFGKTYWWYYDYAQKK